MQLSVKAQILEGRGFRWAGWVVTDRLPPDQETGGGGGGG